MEIKIVKDGKAIFEGSLEEAENFMKERCKDCYEMGTTEKMGFYVDGKEICTLSIVEGQLASPRGYGVAARMVESSKELPDEFFDLENTYYMDPEDEEAFR